MKRVNDNWIILSRRNVESLLHMLDNRDKAEPALVGDNFIVQVEEDEVHYMEREPGTMSWERS